MADKINRKTVSVPENYLEIIRNEQVQYNIISGDFLNLAMKVSKHEEQIENEKLELAKIRKRLLKKNEELKITINKAFNKLNLEKEKKYNWSWNGEAFVGILKEENSNKEE